MQKRSHAYCLLLQVSQASQHHPLFSILWDLLDIITHYFEIQLQLGFVEMNSTSWQKAYWVLHFCWKVADSCIVFEFLSILLATWCKCFWSWTFWFMPKNSNIITWATPYKVYVLVLNLSSRQSVCDCFNERFQWLRITIFLWRF
jgi:hypothetical protein